MSSDLPSAIQQLPATVITPEASSDRMDAIAAEVPVALVFNGISHAVMMCTPQNLEAFALGFALSEGLIDQPADCYGIEVQPLAACGSDPEAPGISVEMQIASRCFARLKEKRRALTGRTGCGICGIDSMDALDLVPQPLPPLADWASGLGLAALQTAFAQLPAMQLLNQQAGAIHAAGWASADGQLQVVLEDVGRHNALDKLLGRLARAGQLEQPGFVVLSSRGSHELVRKCAKLGIGALATISAPTAMGVQMAELTGLRFWGLCRPPQATLYAAGRGLTLDCTSST